MSFSENLTRLRAGGKAAFPANASSREFAQSMDKQEPLRHLREQYIIPTKGDIKKRRLGAPNDTAVKDASAPSVYFCGNSLGLQPKATREYINAHLETWSSIGVQGHFAAMENSPLTAWQDLAGECARLSAPIVGASPEEVVIMNTLTANLHLLMASFYKPTEKRHKIIAEWKPFPSDSYAIESQLKMHGLDTASSLVEVQPDADMYISTDSILKTIDDHADDTALLLLPGIQYYSGQLFDIERITAHAHAAGITVGWDLAHAAGNVELRLHDWDVDFAVWCTYKYMNSGPGGIGGAFVHGKHGRVEAAGPAAGGGGTFVFRPRLSGWYGNDKSVRFNMAKTFQPTPGAQGYQVSNPSAIDLASLRGALSVFEQTSIKALRDKSLVLTAYAEHLLSEAAGRGSVKVSSASEVTGKGCPAPFKIISPPSPLERGAQLSVLFRPGLMEKVGAAFEEAGIICDQRKPDVIRIAPVPMYNTFEDVWTVVDTLRRAIE